MWDSRKYFRQASDSKKGIIMLQKSHPMFFFLSIGQNLCERGGGLGKDSKEYWQMAITVPQESPTMYTGNNGVYFDWKTTRSKCILGFGTSWWGWHLKKDSGCQKNRANRYYITTKREAKMYCLYSPDMFKQTLGVLLQVDPTMFSHNHNKRDWRENALVAGSLCNFLYSI